MSGRKFASLTAGLLARKGEAVPSAIAPSAAFRQHVPAAIRESMSDCMHAPERAGAPRARAPLDKGNKNGDKPRRLMVTLAPAEYETLGIIAVKKGITRHRLLRLALDEYLALLVEEYEGDCHCIQTGCPCATTY